MKKLPTLKIVSACLAGINCKYDGTNNLCPKIAKMVQNAQAIPVCPEVLGGLSVPRQSVEIKNNQIISKNGENFTAQFERGAKVGLKLVQTVGAKEVILKARSPSCGFRQIYDGTFSKKLVKGDGVFAKLLKLHNFKIKTEEEI